MGKQTIRDILEKPPKKLVIDYDKWIATIKWFYQEESRGLVGSASAPKD